MFTVSGGSVVKVKSTGYVSIPISELHQAELEACQNGEAKVNQINFSIPFLTNFSLSNCALKTIGEEFGYEIKVTEQPEEEGAV